MTAQPTTFKIEEKLIDIKKGDKVTKYLPVLWRLVWFREQHPNGTIDTELVHLDLDRHFEVEVTYWKDRKQHTKIKEGNGYALFKASISTGEGGRSCGHKKENAANFGDFEEKAETGSIGRALAALGFGTQFTDEEFAEGERLADSPVQRGNQNGQRPQQPRQQAAPAAKDEDPAVDGQISSIKKLYAKVGREPENLEGLTYGKAKEIIQKLNAELKGQSAAQKAEAPAKAQSNGHPAPAPEPAQTPATDQQKASIEKLCERLKKQPPAVQTFNQAREVIRQLTAEYRAGVEEKKRELEAEVPEEKLASQQQIDMIKELHEKLGEQCPDGVEGLPQADAEQIILKLHQQFRESQGKGQTQQPAASEQGVTIKAATQALYNAALQAKNRGKKLGIADDAKWEALLDLLGIKEFTNGADIAKVNGKLTEIEKKSKES